MTTAQKAELNNSGMKYGLAPGDFMNFLNAEIQEKEDLRLSKLQEEEKQAMSGRKARRERRAYKDRIIMRKGYISPPSYAATNSPPSDISHHSSSRSRSSSNSPETIVYITSFGENESDDGEKRLNTLSGTSTFGPALPPINAASNPKKLTKRLSRSRTPERRKLRSLSKSPMPRKDRSNNEYHGYKLNRSSSLSSGSSTNERRKESRSRNYKYLPSKCPSSSGSSRSRSTTKKHRRSRSRDYESRKRNSLSRGRRRRYRERSNSRRIRISSRSSERQPRKRSRSPDTPSKSRSRTPTKKRFNVATTNSTNFRSINSLEDNRKTSNSNTRSESRTPATSRSDSSSSKGSKQELTQIKFEAKSDLVSRSTAMKLPSPPVKRYYGREKALKKERGSSASFSSSDTEVDKTETKNSNNKISSTRERSSHYCGSKSKSSVSSSTKVLFTGEASNLKSTPGIKPQDRLKRRMQTALNRQLKADKEAQKSRFERQEQERLEREDSLRELSIKYRRRERERRHRHHGRDSRSCSISSNSNSIASSQSGSSGVDRSGSPFREF